MGTTTTNYSLYKPDDGESGYASLVNASMDAIDTQLKANADAIDEAGGGGGGTFERCRVRLGANFTIPTATTTPIQWDYEEDDADDLHDDGASGVGLEPITIATTGWYVIYGLLRWGGGTAGKRGAILTIDGSTYGTYESHAEASESVGTPVYNELALTAGQLLRLAARQDTGNDESVLGGGSGSYFGVRMVGA